ncbi:sulfotransferase family protein [Salinibacter sp.]|uniref:sulfotransferase family protein n=1 Tax=Salinibacter sp. TaxID=2065818 RepID=UPI0021E7D795|nr:sulfotransferase family protein [Salinibacter sp.]
MILSHEHEFIFVHIPRTAGTRLSKEICKKIGIKKWREYIGEPEELINREGNYMGNKYSGEYRRWEGNKHISAVDLKKRLDKDVWKSYFKFAVVRNPWDRVLSLYLKRIKDSALPSRIINNCKICFNSYLNMKFNIGFGGYKRQTDFILDREENMFLDYVGKYERMESDLRKISEKIGIDLNVKGKYDSTMERDYREFYLFGSEKIIEDIFIEEIKMFGYSFE